MLVKMKFLNFYCKLRNHSSSICANATSQILWSSSRHETGADYTAVKKSSNGIIGQILNEAYILE